MSKFQPPQDPFDPQPQRGDRITAAPLKADNPDVVKDKVPTPSESLKQDMEFSPKPSSAKKERATATDQAAKVQKAASTATKSQAELQASDRGPVQASGPQNQPLTTADGYTIESEESAPPEPPEMPELPEQRVQNAPLPAPKPEKQPKAQPTPKADREPAQARPTGQDTPEPPKREKQQDGAITTSERTPKDDNKEVVDAIKALAEVMIEIRNDQRELLYYAREASSAPTGLGSQA